MRHTPVAKSPRRLQFRKGVQAKPSEREKKGPGEGFNECDRELHET